MCKARLKRLSPHVLNPIVLAHLHSESIKVHAAHVNFDGENWLIGSFISHIELSLESKTRVDKHEKLLRRQKSWIDKACICIQFLYMYVILDTVSKTLKMSSYFCVTNKINKFRS